MNQKREIQTIAWAVLHELEEAGEDDLCALLNTVMPPKPHYGSGDDLAEFLQAIALLENQRKVRVREYWDDGRRRFGDAVGKDRRPPSSFRFDAAERYWEWLGAKRQLVEVEE